MSVSINSWEKMEGDARQFRVAQEAINNLEMQSTAGSYWQTSIWYELDRAIGELHQEARDQIRKLDA